MEIEQGLINRLRGQLNEVKSNEGDQSKWKDVGEFTVELYRRAGYRLEFHQLGINGTKIIAVEID